MAGEVKEIGILFKGEMVRAILAGTKTQTRRLAGLEKINERPDDWAEAVQLSDGSWSFWYPGGKGTKEFAQKAYPGGGGIKCPYGRKGDKLWVREVWACSEDYDHQSIKNVLCSSDTIWWREAVERLVNSGMASTMDKCHGKWRPSIHMPKWACRLWLENVTDPYPMRLQDISEEDAKAEGCEGYFGGEADYSDFSYQDNSISARDDFKQLWDSINPKYPWEKSPWVWRVEFKRVKP